MFAALPALPRKGPTTPAIERNWDKSPAILNIPDMPETLWACGDPHGDYNTLWTLLAANNLVGSKAPQNWLARQMAGSSNKPKYAEWRGGAATLVVTGDLIDKGYNNIQVLDLMMVLQGQASAAGGRVIVTLGNHEAAFLAKPDNAKSRGPGGLLIELWGRNLSPKAFASDADVHGYWLRRLPFGARVGNWFFSHAGQTNSRTLSGMNNYLREGVRRDGFSSAVLTNENSTLRARGWYGNNGEQGPLLANLLGVDHIGFGHDADSESPVGEILAFGKTGSQHSLFRLDTGMSRYVGFSQGELLRVRAGDKEVRIDACDHKGRARPLSTDPLPPRTRTEN